jgi:hypothetical protein
MILFNGFVSSVVLSLSSTDMKYYLFFTLAFGAILGWNVFLIQRDNKMFDAYKHRQQQMCEQLKEFSSDCK